MSGTDLPVIDEGVLQRALPAFPVLGTWQRVLRNGLSINTAACLFETSTGTWFAKLEDLTARSSASLREEHTLIRHAAAKGFPVPAVLVTTSGDTLWIEGDRALVVTETAKGEDRYGHIPVFAPIGTLAETEEAGRCLARLHLAWSDFPLPASRPWVGMTAQCRLVTASSAEDVIEGWLMVHPVLRGRLHGDDRERFRRYLAARLPRLAPLAAQWPVGVIHGDFIKRNLFWTGERISAVIDFGLWNVAPWLLDLAFALLPVGFDWPALLKGAGDLTSGRLRTEALRAMRQGYESLRPLTAAEAAGLPLLMAVARLEFYLGIIALAQVQGRWGEAERFWGLLNGVMAWFEANPDWQEKGL